MQWLLEKMRTLLRIRWSRGRKRSASTQPSERQRLVKSRPLSLEQRYQLLTDEPLADDVFRRIQKRLFEAIDRHHAEGGPTIFRESGRLAPGRPYFFVKPQDATGWLFERSGPGWVVTPAEKIVSRDLFLRATEAIDLAQIYVAPAASPRVKSRTDGESLLALSVYESRVLNQLGLH